MQTITIGFGYKARRGKDTACRAIVECLGASVLDVRQYAFADELREEVTAAVFDRWVQEYRDSPFEPIAAMQLLCIWAGVSSDANATAEPGYPYGKQRALYQWWGTEYRRSQDPNYWVKRLAARIKREAPHFAVISDVRFFNEFEFCDYRVRMDRPGFEIADGGHHISENQLDVLPADRWDAVITATTPEEVEEESISVFASLVARARRFAALPADPAFFCPAR